MVWQASAKTYECMDARTGVPLLAARLVLGPVAFALQDSLSHLDLLWLEASLCKHLSSVHSASIGNRSSASSPETSADNRI